MCSVVRYRITVRYRAMHSEDAGLRERMKAIAHERRRFARNGRDWHTLIEFCDIVDTLIVDENGIYDPRHPNDRPSGAGAKAIRDGLRSATLWNCRLTQSSGQGAASS